MLPLWVWLALLHGLLAGGAVLLILRTRGEPRGMLAWMYCVTLIPILGPTLYALVGSNRVKRKARRRRRNVAHLLNLIDREAEARACTPRDTSGPLLAEDQKVVERLTRRLVEIPAVAGNEVAVYNEAEETYAGLANSIRAARRHIHLQYYIWQPDETGAYFRQLLIDKAKEGVKCRVLLDAVGCFGLSRKFVQPWINAGVQVAFFMPLFPSMTKRWSLNLRNHRKIAVIDGLTAFAGSQNIGDEYRGRLKKLSPWYDTHFRIRGPAALFLQQTFAEDWAFATNERLTGDSIFPPPELCGTSDVQILPTGPDQDVGVLGQLTFAAVSSAKSTIRIGTPYFVPDAALQSALIQACYRGVRVSLVLPTRSDNPLTLWAGRSYYAELLDAGVEIFEFDDGMLHSKIMCVDDRWCMLGSANMDVRSFRLNFEITAIVYDQAVAAGMGRYIETRCNQSRRILANDVWAKGLLTQAKEGFARLFTPVL